MGQKRSKNNGAVLTIKAIEDAMFRAQDNFGKPDHLMMDKNQFTGLNTYFIKAAYVDVISKAIGKKFRR